MILRSIEDFARIYLIKPIALSDNDINSSTDIYIGRTTLSLNSRFTTHIFNAKSNNQSKLYKRMRELGVDNWEIILLRICKKKYEDRFERYYINKFNSITSGLNTA